MHFFTKTTLLALATLVPLALTQSEPVSTGISVGSPCDSSIHGQYQCAADHASIIICHLGTWETTSVCGPECCAYNEVNYLPFCYC
ncbi:hypothetical protein BJX63DRAFT_375715 [Aspergillus granulosus]|uniref:Uncharacterized protein n=1 Tax=Aspergillus granulosus TaxID=176169 RepID=A0ABR4I540_9EURO